MLLLGNQGGQGPEVCFLVVIGFFIYFIIFFPLQFITWTIVLDIKCAASYSWTVKTKKSLGLQHLDIN